MIIMAGGGMFVIPVLFAFCVFSVFFLCGGFVAPAITSDREERGYDDERRNNFVFQLDSDVELLFVERGIPIPVRSSISPAASMASRWVSRMPSNASRY